ncbi:TPA: hypothetical protein RY405_004579 [Escherichia albertii]|uniref:hypothetical protein n=1 Tax=Escherichia albertii TaxID=208962 RepID=UPI0016A3D893|nr:hypothetical protein [Escherichia albertii]MCE7712123.1 hypothetical protein [Escherichia albertii]MCU7288868.1 hypothetical protein [Escherichia albertii]MCZ8703178.1 hypothetical protein [Escherichia albertii]MCZ8863644.1 hypothetical protein [Escherichia albertii]MCZ8939866.1 hypothetical protein [Escherichia albertii]
MAGLTKAQRAQRDAAQKNAVSERKAAQTREPQKTPIKLVVMMTENQIFPGAPTIANVHPDEVDNWKAQGWKTQE